MITTGYKENVLTKLDTFRSSLSVKITDRNTIVAVARTSTPVFAQLQAEYNEKIVAAEAQAKAENEFHLQAMLIKPEIRFPHLWGGFIRNKRKPRVRI